VVVRLVDLVVPVVFLDPGNVAAGPPVARHVEHGAQLGAVEVQHGGIVARDVRPGDVGRHELGVVEPAGAFGVETLRYVAVAPRRPPVTGLPAFAAHRQLVERSLPAGRGFPGRGPVGVLGLPVGVVLEAHASPAFGMG
jgi:hypothetical protein